MRLSAKKQSELYNSIREPIMDLRVINKSISGLDEEKLDEALFRLELRIWYEVKKSLKVKD